MLMLVGKIFSDLQPAPPPPIDYISGENLHDLVKILGNAGQTMTTPPPPNVRVLKHVGRQHDDDGNQYNE